MSSKTKNILRNIGFMISIPVIILAFVFAISEDKRSNVQAIEVEILNSNLGFVTNRDIERSLMAENVVPNHSAIEVLDITALEEKVNSNPWVEHAEIFVTSAQCIKVRLKQVEPMLRVQRTDSTINGYYLSEKGSMIPLSRNYSADLPILTAERSLANMGQKMNLVKMAQFIQQDTFWNATISQINLDANNDIELISLIGDAKIRFGTTENMEDKFFRLFQFYKKGINRINWANVKELDLRFDKQLVCRRYHKERLIEERRAPALYAKTKPVVNTFPAEQIEKSVLEVAVAEEPKVTSRAASQQRITKKTVVATPVKVEPAKKQPEKVVAKVAQPAKEEKEVSTPSVEPKKKLKKEVTEVIKPKPKKKKRDIIINTEPVTKKATQE